MAAALDAAFVDGEPIGVSGESIGENQRGAAARVGVVHGDDDDSAEREAADVGSVHSELVHRGDDGVGIIVARGALWGGVAVAVARIIERDRPAGAAKMVELGVPN